MNTPNAQREEEFQPETLLLVKAKTGHYIFQTKRYNLRMEIDGKVIDFSNVGIGVEFAKKPKKGYILETVNKLTHYVSIESEDTKISPNEYNNELAVLSVGSKLGNDGARAFDDFECEFKYRWFLRKWQAVNVRADRKVEVRFEVVDMVESEYPEIIPLYQYESTPTLTNQQCKYISNYQKYFKEICDKRGIKELAGEYTAIPRDNSNYWQNTSHSLIRYVKINGKQVFNSDIYKNNDTRLDTYENCVKMLERDKEQIELHITNFFIETKKVQLTKLEKGNLIKSLRDINSEVARLDVKMKDSREHTNVVKTIRELILLLEANVDG